MKPLKIIRKISNAVNYICDSFSSEMWFIGMDIDSYHHGESQLEEIRFFDVAELEKELLECAENDNELQDTFTRMMEIWNGAHTDILDVDVSEMGWGDKYGEDEANHAYESLDSLDRAIGEIERKFMELSKKYGLKYQEEQPRTNTKDKTKCPFIDYMDCEDKEERLYKARYVNSGTKRDRLRKILDICFPEPCKSYPTFEIFTNTFGEFISKTEYYNILKDYRPNENKPTHKKDW